MPITIDDTGLLQGLDALIERMTSQAEKGLTKQASVAESEMHSTNAHGDITGATRASYRAFLIGGTHTGAAAAESGLEAAIAAIANATTDHGGRPASMDSGVRLGQNERGVLMTSYTDYQVDLEIHKPVLLPTLQANAQAFTQAVAQEGL